jgi:serine/threonine protein phosphatase PrpC
VAKYFDKIFDRFVKKNKSKGTNDSSSLSTDEQNKVNDKGVLSNHKAHQFEAPKESISLKPPQFIAGSSQSVGLQRDQNEDALFSLTTTLAGDTIYLPFGLYIIADGMGGHQHGEIASSIAIRAMAEHIINNLFIPLVGLSPNPLNDSIQDILKSGVEAAHKIIKKKVMEGGTTLTTVVILGDQMVIAHIGDCRVYTVDQEGRMKVITRDHSLVNRLVELGQLTPEEAEIHPQRNVLYRALGQGEMPEPDIINQPRPKPGHVLICSDGLWGVVNEENLSQIITSSHLPFEACQKMIEKANEAGGPDNITTILVQLPESNKVPE